MRFLDAISHQNPMICQAARLGTVTEHEVEFQPKADVLSQEMATFVSTELLTDTWMRALSPKDAAAKASDRTDHGPYGAYDGWPPLTVAAFARLGEAHTQEEPSSLFRFSLFSDRLAVPSLSWQMIVVYR